MFNIRLYFGLKNIIAYIIHNTTYILNIYIAFSYLKTFTRERDNGN